MLEGAGFRRLEVAVVYSEQVLRALYGCDLL